MSLPYHDGDTLDQAFDLWCQTGRSSDQLRMLADRLGIEPDDLLQRWGLPSLKPVPTDQDQDFDLWSFEKLEGQL